MEQCSSNLAPEIYVYITKGTERHLPFCYHGNTLGSSLSLWKTKYAHLQPFEKGQRVLKHDQWHNHCHGNGTTGLVLFLLRCTFLVPSLKATALRYQCTPNDHHSLAPLYSRTFDANPNKVYIFWELNNCRLRWYIHRHKKMYGFPNIARYFPKYRGSLIKFVSGQIWSGKHDQHRYVFLTPFSKKRCREILITCLVCFWHAVKLWELIKHALSSLKRS